METRVVKLQVSLLGERLLSVEDTRAASEPKKPKLRSSERIQKETPVGEGGGGLNEKLRTRGAKKA